MKAVEGELVLACQQSALQGRRSKVVHDLRPRIAPCLAVLLRLASWVFAQSMQLVNKPVACTSVSELARNQIQREELIVSANTRTSA